MTNDDHMEVAIAKIEAELEEQLAFFEKEGKLLEAQRLKKRTEYDIEMLREMGFWIQKLKSVQLWDRLLTFWVKSMPVLKRRNVPLLQP